MQVPQSVQRLAVEIEGWLDMKCPERALDRLETLLEVPGARPVGLALRTRAHVDMKRYADALGDLAELRSFEHDEDWADLTEAWCRKRSDDLEGAKGCMERLIARRNHSAIGHFNLGCYLALLGDRSRALDEVTVACGIDPTFRRLLAEESDLDSLGGMPEFESLKGGD